MDAVIMINELRLKLGKKEVISGLNLRVNKGELIYIVGRNGSGKSTLFNVIAGRYSDYLGEVIVSESIAYQEQKPIHFPDMTTIENLESLNILFKSKLGKDAIDKILDELALQEIRNLQTSRMSGGEKQRLALAITLMRNKEIYLLDEADSSMDPIGRHKYFQILKELKNDGKTVLWISHHLKESIPMADKICLLKDGKACTFTLEELSAEVINYSEDAFLTFLEERLMEKP